jgi:hypothetical protein
MTSEDIEGRTMGVRGENARSSAQLSSETLLGAFCLSTALKMKMLK